MTPHKSYLQSRYGLVPSEQGLDHGPSTSGRNQQDCATSRHRQFQLPIFRGTSTPAEFVEWEYHLVRAFDGHQMSESKKAKLAIQTFDDNAYDWWCHMSCGRERRRVQPITTWVEMRHVMREHFVSSCYRELLEDELSSLRQGTKTVLEYCLEFDDLVIKTYLQEEEGMLMDLFESGLKRTIRRWLELYEITSLQSMMLHACGIENEESLMKQNSSSIHCCPSNKKASPSICLEHEPSQAHQEEFRSRIRLRLGSVV